MGTATDDEVNRWTAARAVRVSRGRKKATDDVNHGGCLPGFHGLIFNYQSGGDQKILVGRAGVEPTTNGLKVRCSTN